MTTQSTPAKYKINCTAQRTADSIAVILLAIAGTLAACLALGSAALLLLAGRRSSCVTFRGYFPGRIAAMPPQMTTADNQNTGASPNRLPSPPNTSGMAN